MLVMVPQVRARFLLCLAALLTLAVAVLIQASRHEGSRLQTASLTELHSGSATSGSTAHARAVYRASLGR
jgi:hypothetical protein